MQLENRNSPKLRSKNEVVDPKDPETKKLAETMFEKMYEWQGIGLAAPQIGINKRLAVVDIGDGQKYILINPEITYRSKLQTRMEEGCLNFPDEFYKVNRPRKIRIKYHDLEGNTVKQKASGLLAKAFQHETDHLNQTLIIDKAKDND